MNKADFDILIYAKTTKFHFILSNLTQSTQDLISQKSYQFF